MNHNVCVMYGDQIVGRIKKLKIKTKVSNPFFYADLLQFDPITRSHQKLRYRVKGMSVSPSFEGVTYLDHLPLVKVDLEIYEGGTQREPFGFSEEDKAAWENIREETKENEKQAASGRIRMDEQKPKPQTTGTVVTGVLQEEPKPEDKKEEPKQE